MVEVINKYETIFVLNPSLSEEETQALVDKFTSLIESAGTLESTDVWGKRRLAYPIDDYEDGYYVLVNFSSKTDFPAELERIYKITDGVLRSIVIKK